MKGKVYTFIIKNDLSDVWQFFSHHIIAEHCAAQMKPGDRYPTISILHMGLHLQHKEESEREQYPFVPMAEGCEHIFPAEKTDKCKHFACSRQKGMNDKTPTTAKFF